MNADNDLRILYRRLEEQERLLAVYRGALEDIKAKESMTMLGNCCVEEMCKPYYDDEGKEIGSCSHTYGVHRGFAECASIATEALEAGAAKGKS